MNSETEQAIEMIKKQVEEFGLCEVIDGITTTHADMKELENNIFQLIAGELEENDLLEDMANRALRFEYYRSMLNG